MVFLWCMFPSIKCWADSDGQQAFPLHAPMATNWACPSGMRHGSTFLLPTKMALEIAFPSQCVTHLTCQRCSTGFTLLQQWWDSWLVSKE